jgi:hypothetical protein
MNSFDTLHSEMHLGFSILFYFWREIKGEASKGPKGFFSEHPPNLPSFYEMLFNFVDLNNRFYLFTSP